MAVHAVKLNTHTGSPYRRNAKKPTLVHWRVQWPSESCMDPFSTWNFRRYRLLR